MQDDLLNSAEGSPDLKRTIRDRSERVASPDDDHGSRIHAIVDRLKIPIAVPIARWKAAHDPKSLLNLKDEDSALVLLSGGIDSTVALFLAKASGYHTTALEFDYPSRPHSERERVRRLASAAGVELITSNIPDVYLDDASPPHRLMLKESNTIYFSMSAAIAQALGISAVVGGQILSDWIAGNLPAGLPSHFDELNGAIKHEYGSSAPRITMPLLFLDKREVVKLGAKLGIPFELTWSCERDGDEPCASCPQCAAREDAMTELSRKGFRP